MDRRSIRESIFNIVFRAEFNDYSDEATLDYQIECALNEIDGDLYPDNYDGFVDPELTEEEIMAKKSVEDLADRLFAMKPMTDIEKAYIRDKVKDIIAKLDTIDGLLSETSEGWNIGRIAKPELAILRLAVYEIRFDEDIPYKVAINEAVELTKKYCNPEATAFVNGILGKISGSNS